MKKNGKMGGENILGKIKLNYHDEKIKISKNWQCFF
jgi:hypothetical protein